MAAEVEIVVKWSGDEYKISGLSGTQCVKDLKSEIQKQTGVLPERQKLLGFKYKGNKLDNRTEASSCVLTHTYHAQHSHLPSTPKFWPVLPKC